MECGNHYKPKRTAHIMLIFRNLTNEQAQQISWQTQQITPLLPAPDYAAAMLRSGGTVFVILDQETVIGLLAMEHGVTDSKPPCGIVAQLVVLPAHRRQSLGRMLMGLAANDAAAHAVWFLAGNVPDTPDAAAFANAIHMKQVDWLDGLSVLDLSDVDGLRYG